MDALPTMVSWRVGGDPADRRRLATVIFLCRLAVVGTKTTARFLLASFVMGLEATPTAENCWSSRRLRSHHLIARNPKACLGTRAIRMRAIWLAITAEAPAINSALRANLAWTRRFVISAVQTNPLAKASYQTPLGKLLTLSYHLNRSVFLKTRQSIKYPSTLVWGNATAVLFNAHLTIAQQRGSLLS